MQKFLRLTRLLSALALVFSLPATAGTETLQLTPVIAEPLALPLMAVRGSDGDYHLVYELRLTNVSPEPWRVERVRALEKGKVLAEWSGAELQARMGPLGKRGGWTELGPNQSAFLWLHLKFPSRQALPGTFGHQISLSGTAKPLEMTGAEVRVSGEEAPVIGPPLRGGVWLAGDGCCDSVRHVRALLPINDRLYAAQRFAIDWEKIDGERKLFSGDAKNPENYFCYGQEVLAVADGEVVAMLDGLPNQVPGKLPEGLDIKQADGNHVILRLASGHYALYAHLKPGSVRVKVGDRVREGQVLGQVGNTGNTSEPHLHFHLMDGPSPLASNGIPYRLRSFEILGRAQSTAAFDKAAAEGSALPTQPAVAPLGRRDEMPVDLSLVRFP